MRVWDVPPAELCDRHLVGEHAEIHAAWSVITNGKAGYAHHPEVERWREHLPSLRRRHDTDVAEMTARGFNHRSPLTGGEDAVEAGPPMLVNTVEEQRALLAAKPCSCGHQPTAQPPGLDPNGR